mgnify:CR=1 FL=1
MCDLDRVTRQRHLFISSTSNLISRFHGNRSEMMALHTSHLLGVELNYCFDQLRLKRSEEN